jgi:hypothetical protein
MGLRAPLGNELVADPPRKRQIGDGRVEVPQLAAPDTEFDPAKAMVMCGNAGPARYSGTHSFYPIVSVHRITRPAG